MRRSLLILLLPIACFVARAQDTLDFARYKWGTPLSVMQEHFGLKLPKAQGGTVSYSSNLLNLGDAILDDCEFEFTDGRFSGIAATTPGKADSKKLLSWLESKFGPGESLEPLGWQWFKGQTHIWFDMAQAGEGWLYWYSLQYQPLKGSR